MLYANRYTLKPKIFIALILVSALYLPYKHASAGLIFQRPNYTGLNNGLVGYWSFDGKDMSVNTALDRSGQGNNGALTNGPTRIIGKVGQALSFDSIDDYINVPNSTSLKPASAITVAAWFYWDNPLNSATGKIISFPSDLDQEPYISYDLGQIGDTNEIWWDINVNGTRDSQGARAFISTKAWHYVVGTWSSSEQLMKLYVDGVLAATDSTDAGTITYYNQPLFIGTTDYPDTVRPTAYIDGDIDDVRIYNRSLSPDEIKRLYRIGATLHTNTQINNDTLKNGLVGYWSFDGKDMNATQALDRSGQGNHGTLNNGPVRTIGKLGQALSFDGVNDYVDIANESNFDFERTNPFSISAWVNVANLNGGGCIVCKQLNSGNFEGWSLGWDPTGGQARLFAELRNSGAAEIYKNTATLYSTTGGWMHISMTYDGSSSVNGMTLYINGSKITLFDTTVDTLGSASILNNNSLQISGRAGANFLPAGQIDDVRIYNRALSPNEITRLYRIGATLHTNTQINNDTLKNGLVGWWTFDGADMNATKAQDKSGQGNHGTLTNGPVRTIGKLGQALNFDGSTSNVSVSDNATLDFGTATNFSISAWVKSSLSGFLHIASDLQEQTDSTDGGWSFLFQNKLLRMYTTSDTWNFYCILTGTTIVADGNWHHVAGVVTREGSCSTSSILLYVDGVSETATKTGVTATNVDISNDDPLTIGAYYVLGAYNQGFNGLLDDVRLYNRALTADEVKRLYNLGR